MPNILPVSPPDIWVLRPIHYIVSILERFCYCSQHLEDNIGMITFNELSLQWMSKRSHFNIKKNASSPQRLLNNLLLKVAQNSEELLPHCLICRTPNQLVNISGWMHWPLEKLSKEWNNYSIRFVLQVKILMPRSPLTDESSLSPNSLKWRFRF